MVLCMLYRLAMRSAGGLSGPRGLAVPLGTEYECNDMNGSLHSSRRYRIVYTQLFKLILSAWFSVFGTTCLDEVLLVVLLL